MVTFYESEVMFFKRRAIDSSFLIKLDLEIVFQIFISL